MPPTTVPVSVICNLSGVSYNSTTKTWSGAPTWNVPDHTPVRPGSNTVQWTLRPAAVPSGFQAAFTATNGIQFKASSNWPGGTPTLQTDGTYTADDTFTAPPATLEYPYSVNVAVTSQTDSTVSTTFTLDPDVDNEPGSIMHQSK